MPLWIQALLAVFIACGCDAFENSVTLSDGVKMPLVSYGANLYDAATCKQATGDALRAGIRFIWSSAIIGEECQRSQAEAIAKSGIERSELFIAGTVDTDSCSSQQKCYEQTKAGGLKQLDILKQQQLDMLMLDYPSSAGCDGIRGQWTAFVEFLKAGKVRTIAVSNFSPQNLQCVQGMHSSPMPTVNQLLFNAGPNGKKAVIADNTKFGVFVQAYSPLGTGGLVQNPVLTDIGKSHHKSAAQVALRWIIQRGAGINVASTSLKHLQEDGAIFDFKLSDQEMDRINGGIVRSLLL